MTVAGARTFQAPRDLVRCVGTWLLHHYEPTASYVKRFSTILGDPDDLFEPIQLTHAWCIGRSLTKQSRRRRQRVGADNRMTVTLSRHDVGWLLQNLPKFSLPKHEALRGSAVRFRGYLSPVAQRRRGRHALSNEDLQARHADLDAFGYSGNYWYKLDNRRRAQEEEAERRRLWAEFYRDGGKFNVSAIIGATVGDRDEFQDWLDRRAKNLPNKV